MSFPLSGNQIVIGREEGMDIALQDPESSRRHALVSWRGGQFVIEDLGSTNGTFVNGVQITAPQVLNPGDSIGIGQTALVFHTTEAQMDAHLPPQQAPAYSAAPEPTAGEESKTMQYLLYGIGCLLLLCICLLLAVAVWVLVFPDSLEQLTGSVSMPLVGIYSNTV
jgi:pSer/pThr/pTyr-binding forkhead associated (FHA) protein